MKRGVLPEQCLRGISEGLADAIVESWPKGDGVPFTGVPQVHINITAPPLPSRLVRLSKFAKCGLFAQGSEPSRAMLESAEGKKLLPIVKCGGVLFVDLNRVDEAIREQLSGSAVGKRYRKTGSFNATGGIKKQIR